MPKLDWIIEIIGNGVVCAKCGRVEDSFPEYICNAHTHGMKKYHHPDFQLVLHISDTYDLNRYEKTYYVNGVKVVVTNERVGEALKFIMPNKRAVLLLSYFMDYRDSEIARTLRITNSTVSYRKKQALKKLKVLLEGKANV